MPPFNKPLRIAALAGLIAVAGCSEYAAEYTARRDLISIHGGDAVESAKVGMMVDPWPPHAAQRNIAYNGVVMQSAYERYRNGRVIRPAGTGTSSTYEQQQGQNNGGNNSTPVGPTVNQSSSTK